MTKELKQCPFCGVSMHIESTPHWLLLVGDHDEKCVFMGTRTTMIASASNDQHLAQVVSDWNRRATLSPAHIEDEREACERWIRQRSGMPAHIPMDWDVPFNRYTWAAWSARAALSAPPASEQQRAVVMPEKQVEYVGDRDHKLWASGANWMLRELLRLNPHLAKGEGGASDGP